LLLGATTLAIAVLGWYGYRAFVRIETWGRNMNDCDRIFQEAAMHEDGWGPEVDRRRPAHGISVVPPLRTSRDHARAAALK
jgi:hypothetical protein